MKNVFAKSDISGLSFTIFAIEVLKYEEDN